MQCTAHIRCRKVTRLPCFQGRHFVLEQRGGYLGLIQEIGSGSTAASIISGKGCLPALADKNRLASLTIHS
jgi:hypothetical protein